MQLALEEGRSRVSPASGLAPARLSVAGGALLLAAAALTFAAVLAGGGSTDGRLFWIGGGVTLVVSALIGAALAGLVPRPNLTRAGTVCLGALVLLVLLSAASILWSVAPDRSWSYANRGFVHLLFLVLGVFVGAHLERAPRLVAGGLLALVAAAAAWALAGKIAPGLFPDGGRIARLRAPIGYWNGLALLLASGLPLALWLAGGRPLPRSLRAVGGTLVYALIVATVLTYSRGGIVVAGLAVCVWLAFSRSRLESLAVLLVATPAAVAVSAWAFRQPGLVDDFQAYGDRVEDGWQFGIVLAAAGAVVWGFSFLVARYQDANPGWSGRHASAARGLGIGLAGLVAAVLVVLAVRGGDPASWLRAQVDEFADPVSAQVSQDPSRLGTLSSNNRWTWWQQAWGAFVDRPAGGTGAGTFELTNLERRTNSLTVSSPHNVPLQFLSETGSAGLLLFAVAVGAAAVGIREALGRLRGEERAAAAALAAGAAAYLVHSFADKDWDYVAVNAPVFLAVGVLLAAGRERRVAGGRRLLAVGAVVLAWGSLYSLTAPWLSTRIVDRSYALLDREAETTAERRQNVEESIELAEKARSLNPLALEPLIAAAGALDVLGDETRGYENLKKAVELQPDNPVAWYELGVYEFRVIARLDDAFQHLDRAYSIDPYGPAAPVLDELRAIFKAEKEKCFAAGTC